MDKLKKVLLPIFIFLCIGTYVLVSQALTINNGLQFNQNAGQALKSFQNWLNTLTLTIISVLAFRVIYQYRKSDLIKEEKFKELVESYNSKLVNKDIMFSDYIDTINLKQKTDEYINALRKQRLNYLKRHFIRYDVEQKFYDQLKNKKVREFLVSNDKEIERVKNVTSVYEIPWKYRLNQIKPEHFEKFLTGIESIDNKGKTESTEKRELNFRTSQKVFTSLLFFVCSSLFIFNIYINFKFGPLFFLNLLIAIGNISYNLFSGAKFSEHEFGKNYVCVLQNRSTILDQYKEIKDNRTDDENRKITEKAKELIDNMMKPEVIEDDVQTNTEVQEDIA